MRIGTKLTFLFLLLAVFSLSLVCGLFHLSAKSLFEDQVLRTLRAMALIHEGRISASIKQNSERLSLVSSRTQLRLSLASYVEGGDIEEGARMNRILEDARRSLESFESISVLTTAGVIVASTEKVQIGEKREESEALARALEGPVLYDLFLSPAGGLRNRLRGSLRQAGAGRVLGTIEIVARPDSLLEVLMDRT
ncbi:hypothetical protein HQ520_03350, partial [bacterium]|nr:hypothetical protein [bacterium]